MRSVVGRACQGAALSLCPIPGAAGHQPWTAKPPQSLGRFFPGGWLAPRRQPSEPERNGAKRSTNGAGLLQVDRLRRSGFQRTGANGAFPRIYFYYFVSTSVPFRGFVVAFSLEAAPFAPVRPDPLPHGRINRSKPAPFVLRFSPVRFRCAGPQRAGGSQLAPLRPDTISPSPG